MSNNTTSITDRYSIKNILSRLKPREGENHKDRLRRAYLIRNKHIKDTSQ